MSKPAHLYMPPNELKAKLGGPLPATDHAAIARAEKNVADLAENFPAWIADEARKLALAGQAYLADDRKNSHETMKVLHARSHDLRGLAATYGYPLIGRLAASLCRLTMPENSRKTAPGHLIKAHIDAIRAALRDDIKADDNQIGAELAAELERNALAL